MIEEAKQEPFALPAFTVLVFADPMGQVGFQFSKQVDMGRLLAAMEILKAKVVKAIEAQASGIVVPPPGTNIK